MSIPFIPQNIILQTGNGQNFLIWDQVVGATSYSIQRSTDGINWTSTFTSPTNNYLDAAVSVGTNYWYQVASVNVSGTSPYSPPYPFNITPCLPGQIDLGYIRYQAQLRSDKLNSEYQTTDEWNFNINQVTYELYDLLVSKFGDNYFFAPPFIFNLTGQQSYLMPNGAANYSPDGQQTFASIIPAVHKLSGIDVNLNNPSTLGPNNGWVPVPRSNWSDRDRWSMWPGVPAGLNNAYMLSYRPMGDRLFFFPANLNQTVQLWYIPKMTQLLQDTDMLTFSISGWSEYVIVRTALLAMSKETDSEKYGILSAQLQMQIERIETSAANRDVDQPNTVQNVRQTMSDPGFGMGGGAGGGFGGGMGFGY